MKQNASRKRNPQDKKREELKMTVNILGHGDATKCNAKNEERTSLGFYELKAWKVESK